jgi:multisubunit Na+/H+ antiporter MnhG subunit
MFRERTNLGIGTEDRPEDVLRRIDHTTEEKTGMSIFHIFALLSIFASLALFFSGRRMEAIFVGLWPPTIEALKSASERRRLL